MITWQNAIRVGRSLLGTPYSTLDCINFIKKVIRTVIPSYTTAGTNALWRSYDMAKKYKDLTWRQEGIGGAKAGMIAFKADGEDYHHAGIVTDVGTVLHSSSTQGGRGVVETPLTSGEGWTHLAIHRHISIKEEDTPMYKAEVNLASAKSYLNLRNGPTRADKIIGSIPHGAVVDVLAEAADWLYVRYEGKSGYAAAEYLMRVSDDMYVAPEELIPESVPAITITIIDEAGNTFTPVGSWRVLVGGKD